MHFDYGRLLFWLVVQTNRASKYIEREEYLVKTRSSGSGSAAAAASSNTRHRDALSKEVAEGEEEGVAMRAPDWLSTSPADWRFYGTAGDYVRAVDEKSTTIKRSISTAGKSSFGGASSSTTSSSFFESLLKK